MSDQPIRPAYSPLLLVVGAAVLWSTGGLFIKATSLSGLELSFGRSLLAAITVAIFTRREGFGLNRATALAAAIYAILLVLFVLATKANDGGQRDLSAIHRAGLCVGARAALLQRKFRRRDLVTVIFCVLGMSLFFVGKLRPQDVSGNLLALGSGLCFAFYVLLLRHSSARQVNRASSVIYGNLLVVLVAAPAGLAAMRHLSAADAGSVAYLGIVQIGVAYLLFTLAMARGVRSLDAGIIGYIEPVLNPIWVFLVIGERPSSWAILGGAIIVAAVVAHMLTDARGKPGKAEGN